MCLNPFYPITKKGHSSKLKQLAESGISSCKFVFETGSHSPVWPPSPYVAKKIKNAPNPPAFTSQVVGLQACSSTPSLCRVSSPTQELQAYQAHTRPPQLHSQLPFEGLSETLSSPRHPLMVAVTWTDEVNIIHENCLLAQGHLFRSLRDSRNGTA